MSRHQPARFVAVGNDHRLDSERSPQLILEFGPVLGQPALGDHAAKIGVRRSENAVVAVELAIGEPKAVVGAGIEPAAVIFLGSVAQNRGGRADIVGDAVNEDEKIVAERVEHGLAFLESGIEALEVADRRAVEGRRRRLGAEGAKREIPGLFVELQIAARLLQTGSMLEVPRTRPNVSTSSTAVRRTA